MHYDNIHILMMIKITFSLISTCSNINNKTTVYDNVDNYIVQTIIRNDIL